MKYRYATNRCESYHETDQNERQPKKRSGRDPVFAVLPVHIADRRANLGLAQRIRTLLLREFLERFIGRIRSKWD